MHLPFRSTEALLYNERRTAPNEPVISRPCPHRRTFTAVLGFAAVALPASGLFGQSTASLPLYNRNLVLLDPAHGGSDPGAHLKGDLNEKDVTLAFEQKLRSLLSAKGLSVLSTRDSDATLTSDQRADLANHGRPIACILIHATSSGSGAYLATSSLPADAEPRSVLPWDTAQAAYVSQSAVLLQGMTSAFASAWLKPMTLQSSVQPLDSLTCPAVLLEFAPRSNTQVNDQGYQQQLAEAVTTALVAWRTTFDPPKPVVADPTVDPVVPKVAPRPKIKPPVAAPAPPTPLGAPLKAVPSITPGAPR